MHKTSATLLRSLRKHFGLYQSTFADYLETTQGTLSKLEAGQLELSAMQWVSICMRFNLDPNCLSTGLIESIGNSCIKLESTSKVGNFKIPKNYSYLMGSTVRTATPIINYAKEKMGKDKTNEFLQSLGFDPDYFIILSHPLNLKFIEKIVLQLVTMGFINEGNVEKILNLNNNHRIHSFALESIRITKNKKNKLRYFTNTIKDFYEINTSYEYVGESSCLIKAHNAKHIEELNLSSEFQNFRQKFNEAHFNSINKIIGIDHKVTSRKNTTGWDLYAVC